MSSEQYRNIDLDLSAAHPSGSRVVVEGTQGSVIRGLYLARNTFIDDPVPTGAEVRIYLGTGEEILLSNDLSGFEFNECGHDGGIFWNNAVALAGKKLRLLVDYSGVGVQYAR
jgi:hypothetical protein